MPCNPSYYKFEQHAQGGGATKGKTARTGLSCRQTGGSHVTDGRRPAASSSTWIPTDNRTAGVTVRAKDPTATSSGPSFYLMGKGPTSLRNSKLLKTSDVLGRFLSHSDNTSVP